jgi:hypothetical protein
MKFLKVDPAAESIAVVDAPDVRDAAPELFARGVDFGAIYIRGYGTDRGDGISIVVYEYGLLEEFDGPYFALGRSLYAGEAVLYRFDGHGVTVDIGDYRPKPLWLKTREDVELAIAAGMVDRPVTAVNGAVVWQWNRESPLG